MTALLQNRWYQDEAKFAIFDYFSNGGTGNPVLALPTGTGKSVIIADFLKDVFKYWPNQRVMMLTHVKELIEQNANKLLTKWPTAPLGIYSAGLNSRNSIMPIVFAGVQSVKPAIDRALEESAGLPLHQLHFGHRDLVLIDECHLIGPSENSQYRSVISTLKDINPNLKVIGLTATPYRLKQGKITDEGGLFTDICFDLTDVESFNRLIAEGYLVPPIPRRTDTYIDVSNVGMYRGDFAAGQLQAAVDKDEITFAGVKEMVEQGHDRKSWLVFASGVENSEHIAAMLQSFGIQAAACHSKLSAGENDRRISDFKNGTLRCLVNNNKLTTGFDHPDIDLIGMYRPTMSPGLWVQMLGRGTRPAPGKENCLVLDFARNAARLGPINDPVIPKRAGKGGGTPPVKICECGAYNHASARVCIDCGREFEFKTKLFETPGDEELVRGEGPVVEYFEVQKAVYSLHEKKGQPPSIKVSYHCGLQMFSEWVCLEHPGFAGKKARDWWRQRHEEEPPATVYSALQKTGQLRTPVRLRVWVNKKYPEIMSAEW